MARHHWQRALRAAQLSEFEGHASLAGVVLIVAAAAAAFFAMETGAMPRAIGLAGLVAIALAGASRGARLYRAGVRASLPTSLGRLDVPVRPARTFGVAAVAVAFVLPLAVAVAALVLFEAAWLLLAGVVLLGCGAMAVTWAREAGSERPYFMTSASASECAGRLCMRADMPVPEVVVEHAVVANAWTAKGRIHLTSPLLDLLDERELEAVLAHEVAHLARRDAAVMEICSAPSRLLLTFAAFLTPRLARWTRGLLRWGPSGLVVAIWILALLAVPPAFVVGWVSRFSVLGLSRARELSADAAAAALTGRPSALASALLKLEHQREWAPCADLRELEPQAVLCIVATRSSRLGRLFSTHPPTARRVQRLRALESRLQARGQLTASSSAA
jgi:heat shock protein HtpX